MELNALQCLLLKGSFGGVESRELAGGHLVRSTLLREEECLARGDFLFTFYSS